MYINRKKGFQILVLYFTLLSHLAHALYLPSAQFIFVFTCSSPSPSQGVDSVFTLRIHELFICMVAFETDLVAYLLCGISENGLANPESLSKLHHYDGLLI